jgi:hypothetical protein
MIVPTLFITLFLLFTTAHSHLDETSNVIWIRCENPSSTSVTQKITYVNNKQVSMECHHVLNHFYEKGYNVVGYAAASHDVEWNPPEELYSWTMVKDRGLLRTTGLHPS